MTKPIVNNRDPDQTSRPLASYLDLHCLSVTLYRFPDYNGLPFLP